MVKMTKNQINLSVCGTLIVVVGGAVAFLFTTFQTKTDAEAIRLTAEREAVQTFQQLQHIWTEDSVESLQDRKALIEEVLEKEPDNTLFKYRKKEIEKDIKRKEEQLKETEP